MPISIFSHQRAVALQEFNSSPSANSRTQNVKAMQFPAFNSHKTIKMFASYMEWNPLTYFQVTGDALAPNAFFQAGASPEVIQLHCKSRPYKHATQRATKEVGIFALQCMQLNFCQLKCKSVLRKIISLTFIKRFSFFIFQCNV